MKRVFPFLLHKSGTPSLLLRDKNSSAKPATNVLFPKRNSHAILCAGLLLLLTPAAYLLSCGPGSPSSTKPSNPPPAPSSTPGIDVTTYHNDVARTGQNLSETILTPANLSSSSFGKMFVIPVDGKVDGEPLYLSGITVPGKGIHNILYLVTEHGSVYAVDADTGTSLWQVSTLQPGETTSDSHGCSQITPEIGITATPVIDRKAGANGTIYVVAMSKDTSGTYHQRLHALDVTTGAEEFGGPQNVQASFPGTGDNSSGGKVIFDPGQYAERAGLLLLNGVIYMSWTSHCDIRPYTGWIMGYDENNLAQVTVLNVTPNGNEGSFWMSGTAPAADSSGTIYALDANGTFDATLTPSGFPSQGDFGNAFLKISTANKQLAVADYFEVSNQSSENGSDEDLGSGGALVLPDMQDGSGSWRGQGWEYLRCESRFDGKVRPSFESHLPGVAGGLTWRRLFHARVLQQHGLLRSRRAEHSGVRYRQWSAFQRANLPDGHCFSVSREHAKCFCKWCKEWNRVGGGE